MPFVYRNIPEGNKAREIERTLVNRISNCRYHLNLHHLSHEETEEMVFDLNNARERLRHLKEQSNVDRLRVRVTNIEMQMIEDGTLQV